MTRAPGDRIGVGFLGAGNVLGRYLAGLSRFPRLEVRGCATRSARAARAAATEFGIGAYESVEAMLRAPDVDVIVNITPPLAHAPTTAAALAAGKHVYVEKPITTSLPEALRLTEAAEAAGLLLGAAPDTLLGSAAQTARRAVEDGLIGEPVGVAAFITSNRVETWHPDPTSRFQPGGGPVHNIGPYHLTAMVNLLGPLTAVFARARIGAPVRTVTSPGRRVESVTVTTPTHVTAVLEFACGVVGTLIASYDVWDHHLPHLEVYGTEGTLCLPDPNTYDGDVLLRRHTDDEWHVLPPVAPLFAEPGSAAQLQRGPGVADLVAAIDGAPQRASAALACHVLEAIESIETSWDSGSRLVLTTTAAVP
jgi:predicted dehydrogenase